MLCFRSVFWGMDGEFLRLFYVPFPDVRIFEDSCNDLSGYFLLTTSKGSLKLHYPILHSNQPYRIIQLFLLLSTQRVCVAMILEPAGSCNRKGLPWFAFAFSSCPLHFHICFWEGWVSGRLPSARPGESETEFWGLFCSFGFHIVFHQTLVFNITDNPVDGKIKDVSQKN